MEFIKHNVDIMNASNCVLALATVNDGGCKCHLAAILKTGDTLNLSEPEYVWNYPELPINELERFLKKEELNTNFIVLGDGKCALNGMYDVEDITFNKQKDKRFSMVTAVYSNGLTIPLYEIATNYISREQLKITAKLTNQEYVDDDTDDYVQEELPLDTTCDQPEN